MKKKTPINTNNFPRADYPTSKPWEPIQYKATCCGDVIFSKRPGQFTRCSCGGAYVDQTREYTRTNGKVLPLNLVIEEGEQ